MTELSPLITVCDHKDPLSKKALTVGRTYPQTEVKVVNPDTLEVVPWGETGEVVARGYMTMLGYWGDEQKTKESIVNNWMRTGDLGYFDDDCYLRIIGRAKDMIIRGGENIYPREIEEFFMKHPNVQDAQVIGVYDEFMGEEVCIWIKLKEEGDSKPEDFLTYCQGQIAHYKIPRYLRFVT